MGKRWSISDLNNLRPGMVAGMAAPASKPVAKPKIPRKEAPQLMEMKTWLKILKIDFEPEHVFHPTRKWRFDIALPAEKIAIEYEGIYSETSRHTTWAGFSEDTIKYNSAAKMGWRVLRYTSDTYQQFMKDITELLNITTV